ncbi:MAG: alpha/beta hydrolase [Micropepsaceae bacterium]
MSAEEVRTVTELLRSSRGAMDALSWDERRAAMEAGTAFFPLAEGVALREARAGSVPVEWQARTDATDDAALMYLHGGGYAIGSIASHRALTTSIAATFNGQVLSVAYRLAPEDPCPAGLEDAVTAYRYLLDQGIEGSRIVIAGDSAGGGLAIAALQAIRDAGLPRPAGAWVLSPWVDMTATSETMSLKADDDMMIAAANVKDTAAIYAPRGDAADPRATPLNGRFDGLPPLFIQVGTSETLLDDSLTLARKAALANVDVRLETWAYQQHVFQMFALMMSEARDAIAAGIAWANDRIRVTL